MHPRTERQIRKSIGIHFVPGGSGEAYFDDFCNNLFPMLGIMLSEGELGMEDSGAVIELFRELTGYNVVFDEETKQFSLSG